MRIEVYGNREAESVLRLRLVEAKRGVDLVAVDADGTMINCGHLLHIRNDGVLVLHKNVNGRLGLPLDGAGRIVVEEVW